MAQPITLKTRLFNRYDHVTSDSFILGRGEINFVPHNDLVLIKVGDGVTPYDALPYTGVRAEDVVGLETFIAKKVEDTNTTYEFSIEENENGIHTLQIIEKEFDTVLNTTNLEIIVPEDLENYLTKEEFAELNTTVTEMSSALTSVTTTVADHTTKFDDYATLTYVDDAINGILGTEELRGTYDTLKEIGAWVDEHAPEATQLAENVAAMSVKVDAAQTAEQVSDAIDAKISPLDDRYDMQGSAAAALEEAKTYADSLNHEDTTYEAGEGLMLNNGVFSLDTINYVFILNANYVE